MPFWEPERCEAQPYPESDSGPYRGVTAKLSSSKIPVAIAKAVYSAGRRRVPAALAMVARTQSACLPGRGHSTRLQRTGILSGKMLIKLFLLFAVIPVIELALLVEIGGHIGVAPTIAVVLTTGAAGAWLARTQGLLALQRLQQALGAAQFPGEEIFDGVLILAGGLLLLTPGFLTDVVGFLALVPGTRHLLKSLVKSQVRGRIKTPGSGAVHVDYSVD